MLVYKWVCEFTIVYHIVFWWGFPNMEYQQLMMYDDVCVYLKKWGLTPCPWPLQ